MMWLVAYIIGQLVVSKWCYNEEDMSWLAFALLCIFMPGVLLHALTEKD